MKPEGKEFYKKRENPEGPQALDPQALGRDEI